jgi:hypothetical protein
MKVLRSVVSVAVLCTVPFLSSPSAYADACNTGLGPAFAAHQAAYTNLANVLVAALGNLNTQLLALTNQATYAALLTTARNTANGIANGRVLVTVPDGTVVLDTARTDDPTNTMAVGNSFQHFQNKTVNENHNSRIAIFDSQEYQCGLGLEAKLSTTTGQREIYLAVRLGTHLDANGTVRISTRE